MTTLQTTVASVLLPTGVRLEYAEHGEADGVPLVLLHGVSDSWRSFEPVFAHLPPSIHALALTLRGHGDSGRATSYRLEDLVADVAAFMDALGVRSAIVGGHSMGTVVAQRLALDRPDRVDGLVLLGGATTFRPLLEGMTDEIRALTDPLDRDFLREFQASTVAGPQGAAFVETAVEESAKMRAADLALVWEQTLLDDHSSELPRIGVPTLLVWGGHDDMCPASDHEALMRAIPGSSAVVHLGAGHAVHWDAPAAVAADLCGAVWAGRGAGMRLA